MWMILFGGVYTADLEKHLAIGLSAQKLPTASVLTLNSFIRTIITVFAIIFMICGGNIVVEKAQHVGQISPVLKWPVDRVYWIIPVSRLILAWYSVMNIIDSYRKRNSH